MDRCRQERPLLREIAPGQLSACHLNDLPEGAAVRTAAHPVAFHPNIAAQSS
jgi:peptide/nickel transport system ATP-binding protein